MSDSEQMLPIELRDKLAFVQGELLLPGPITLQDNFMIDSGSGDDVDHPIVTKLQSRVSTESGVGLGTAVQGATAGRYHFSLADIHFRLRQSAVAVRPMRPAS